MAAHALMPKATANWLIDNTTLTFQQIADFCGLHPLEVQAIADGEVTIGRVSFDPVAHGQLTAEEIKRCEKDATASLEALEPKTLPKKKKIGKGYIPMAKRGDRPNGIAWILKHHPDVSEAGIFAAFLAQHAPPLRLSGKKPTGIAKISSQKTLLNWDYAAKQI